MGYCYFKDVSALLPLLNGVHRSAAIEVFQENSLNNNAVYRERDLYNTNTHTFENSGSTLLFKVIRVIDLHTYIH